MDDTRPEPANTQTTDDFLNTFRVFMQDVINRESGKRPGLTPLGALLQEHFTTDVRTLPVVSELVAPHRLVDVDVALDALAASCSTADAPSRLIGVSGGRQREHASMSELIANPYGAFAAGPVDYTSVATGVETKRQIVTFGVRLFVFENAPVLICQRGANDQFGRSMAEMTVLSEDPATSSAVLARMHELMLEHSVLRGQVLSLTDTQFGHGAAGATFLARPNIAPDDIVLPPGLLDRVAAQVAGIGEHRTRLLETGQHLKRGVLLYGPPGTGKTLTVRHLLSRTPGTTCVLLTGASIRFISEAAELARAMQPAIVVLEDVDLVAQERGMHGGPQPLLFAVLDALDGLDGDADVAFVLTTNRVDLLEPALAERPGRVDLAVEIPLPDGEAREGLFTLYASGLPLSAAALVAAAARAEGVTASFAKELMRRTVLRAAAADNAVSDDHLSAALDELLSAREQLTRSLLGAAASDQPPAAQR